MSAERDPSTEAAPAARAALADLVTMPAELRLGEGAEGAEVGR